MGYIPTQTCGSASGGISFSDNLTPVGQLIQVSGSYGDYLNQLQETWDRAGGGEPVVGPTYGNVNGGNDFNFTLAEGEHIVRVFGTSGQYVNTINFVTNFGNAYGPYGLKEGSNQYSFTVSEVCGLFGYAGDWINQLGLWEPAPSPRELVA